MKGTYVIPIPAGTEPAAHPKVKSLLANLARTGATVESEFLVSHHGQAWNESMEGGYWHGGFQPQKRGNVIIIRASGGAAPKRTVARPSIVPAPLTVDQCAMRLRAAQRDLDGLLSGLARNMRQQWTELAQQRTGRKAFGYSPELESRRRRIGRALAKLIARHSGNRTPHAYSKIDYELLDRACGSKIRRQSNLPSRYSDLTEYFVKHEARGQWSNGRRRAAAAAPVEPEERNTVGGELAASRAEADHWTEMLRLASERAAATKERKRA